MWEYTLYAFLLSAIALTPILSVFIYKAGFKANLWLVFLLGGTIWFLALIARTPLLLLHSIFPSDTIYFAYASILAGVFEESFRYFSMKKWEKFRESKTHILSMGLGWGFLEALIIYVFSIILIAVFLDLGTPISELPSYTSPFDFFVSGLAGAFERWVATLLHVSLTFLVFQALKKRTYLYLAITIHTVVDFVAVMASYLAQNIILTELVITAFALTVAFYALKVLQTPEYVLESHSIASEACQK
ncbi:MAG: YhfC family intramembrane metalloprotease [Candidatus Odinarchaeota archaeon]|nr:YhfC family intramembrane metalloprotease [Candidatus Odinarchaeota archaeon]